MPGEGTIHSAWEKRLHFPWGVWNQFSCILNELSSFCIWAIYHLSIYIKFRNVKSIARLLFILTAQNYALNRWLKALVRVPRNNDMLIPFLDNGSNPSVMFCCVFSRLSL